MSAKDLPLTSDRNASKFLYVSDMAHREDLFYPAPWDGPSVVKVNVLCFSMCVDDNYLLYAYTGPKHRARNIQGMARVVQLRLKLSRISVYFSPYSASFGT